MRSTLDQLFIKIQKLIFLPFKIDAGMRALIMISKKFPVFMYHEDGERFTFDSDFETFAARVFDVCSFAENMSHNV